MNLPDNATCLGRLLGVTENRKPPTHCTHAGTRLVRGGPVTDEQYVAEQRAAIMADATLTPEDREYLLRWCRQGCPGDEPTDVGFEEGDFC